MYYIMCGGLYYTGHGYTADYNLRLVISNREKAFDRAWSIPGSTVCIESPS